MTKEPLKNKIQNEDVMKQTGKDFFESFWLGVDNSFFYRTDIKSAVEWLKQEDKKVYQEISEILKNGPCGLFSKVLEKLLKLQHNRREAFLDALDTKK